MNEQKPEIAYAGKKDAEQIIALVHKVIGYSLPKIYPPSVVRWFFDYHSVEHIKEEFDGGADVAVIYDSGALIGTATYYDDEIKRVFIHPDYQRSGLGKRLMAELEGIARRRGKKHVMLYANPATWRYYECKGYETTNIAAAGMGNGEYLTYCMMVKRLVPKKWHIAKAEASDADEILAGQKRAFTRVAEMHSHMDMSPMSEVEEEVKRAIENACVFAAKEGGRIVGSVRGEEKDGVCHVARLWVSPDYQGKGIGHALMFAVEDAFCHLDRYELFTGSMTPEAIAFYEERGYAQTRRAPLRDYELVFMEKMNAVGMME